MNVDWLNSASQRDIDQFKSVCNQLLSRTYVVRTLYRPNKGRVAYPGYSFFSIHYEQVRDYLGLVDIGKLRERERLEPWPDSLAKKVETENDLARSYIDYLLGRVVCCSHVDQLRRSKTATHTGITTKHDTPTDIQWIFMRIFWTYWTNYCINIKCYSLPKHGIQEVSGSIPLISTTSPENHWLNSDKELIRLSTVS